MKIINLLPTDDYEALKFEETFSTNPSIDVYNQIKETGMWTDEDGCEYAASVEERDISEESFEYAISLIDYDSSKHNRPFAVKEWV